MLEDKKEKVEKTEEQKKKQKNMMVLFAIAVLIGAGAYYFISSNNMNSSNPSSPQPTVIANEDNSNPTLTSKKWTWVNTKMNDGAVTTPSKDGAFTVTFQDDGRVVATTDCNNGNGSYEVGENNSLTMGPMATTMMFCEGSSQDAYFQQLNNIGSYKIQDGELWLMIKFDSGTMIFK